MTSSDCDKSCGEFEIADAVLAYLERHPQAADTLAGIASWWLPQQRYITAEARIESVLQQLVSQGALQIRRLPNGDALYARTVERH